MYETIIHLLEFVSSRIWHWMHRCYTSISDWMTEEEDGDSEEAFNNNTHTDLDTIDQHDTDSAVVIAMQNVPKATLLSTPYLSDETQQQPLPSPIPPSSPTKALLFAHTHHHPSDSKNNESQATIQIPSETSHFRQRSKPVSIPQTSPHHPMTNTQSQNNDLIELITQFTPPDILPHELESNKISTDANTTPNSIFRFA